MAIQRSQECMRRMKEYMPGHYHEVGSQPGAENKRV
jgi:hypothetical protein